MLGSTPAPHALFAGLTVPINGGFVMWTGTPNIINLLPMKNDCEVHLFFTVHPKIGLCVKYIYTSWPFY